MSFAFDPQAHDSLATPLRHFLRVRRYPAKCQATGWMGDGNMLNRLPKGGDRSVYTARLIVTTVYTEGLPAPPISWPFSATMRPGSGGRVFAHSTSHRKRRNFVAIYKKRLAGQIDAVDQREPDME